MKRVEVKLNLEAVAPLLDAIKAVADELAPNLAISAPVPDPEFAAEWRSELLEGQTSDIRVLLGLFDADFFTSGLIAFDPSNSEPILRACSAVRLRLRAAHLGGLADDHLESGEVDYDELPDKTRIAFAAYVFLATLQELIVQHLDPTILEG